MTDKLTYITNGDAQNYPFCRLVVKHLTLNSTNQDSIKVPKVVKTRNKKTFFIKLWELV